MSEDARVELEDGLEERTRLLGPRLASVEAEERPLERRGARAKLPRLRRRGRSLERGADFTKRVLDAGDVRGLVHDGLRSISNLASKGIPSDLAVLSL